MLDTLRRTASSFIRFTAMSGLDFTIPMNDQAVIPRHFVSAVASTAEEISGLQLSEGLLALPHADVAVEYQEEPDPYATFLDDLLTRGIGEFLAALRYRLQLLPVERREERDLPQHVGHLLVRIFRQTCPSTTSADLMLSEVPFDWLIPTAGRR